MLENLKLAINAKRRYPCRTREIYDSLDAADQEILMNLLVDNSVKDYTLSVALRDQAGIVVADTSLAKHRRGLCSCSKI